MVEKQGQQIWAGVSPPPFRAMPKRKHFFFREGFPKFYNGGTPNVWQYSNCVLHAQETLSFCDFRLKDPSNFQTDTL